MRRTLVLFPILATLCLPSIAEDPAPASEFHGYLRAGAGRSSQGGEQVAFGLNGVAKYRLGNEAENYGELEWDGNVYNKDGATFRVHTMAQFCNSFADGNYAQGTGANNSPSNERDFDMAQYWVEGKGVLGTSKSLKDASLWIGRRYYNRNDIHILDYYFWSNQGIGGGIENVELGFAKFHYAYIQYDNPNVASGGLPLTRTKNSVGVHALRLSDIPANTGGSLMVGLEYHEASPYTGNNTQSDTSNRHGGVAAHIMHIQRGILGGENRFTLQYGTGAAAQLTNGSNPALASGSRMFRAVENLVVQPNPRFGMQAALIYQSAKDDTGVKSTWGTIGARPVFFFSQHFSLATEIGYMRITQDGQASQSLTKETLALQWGPKPDFWSRPVLRVFATNAQWNDAAATLSSPGNGTFADRKSGLTYGLQTEIWW